MLVTPDFFIGEIGIPNVGDATKPGTTEKINLFINEYEPICLRKILGIDLYNSFIADPTTQRMLNLKDGADYTDCYGISEHWYGLVYNTKFSLIANNIYYYYMRDNSQWNSGIGVVIAKDDSLIPAQQQIKLTTAWNKFSRQTKSLVNFLVANQSVYPEFTSTVRYFSLRYSKPIHF